MIAYFKSSLVVTVIGLLLAYGIGHMSGGAWHGLAYVYTAALLAVLEVSISFDNAVANAQVMEDMSKKWRQRFITWGMLIAVFGMRLLFPLMIVSFIGGISWYKAAALALNSPQEYASILQSAHYAIAAFGGTFLMFVGIDFFINDEKEHHWLPFETWLQSNATTVKSLVFLVLIKFIVATNPEHMQEVGYSVAAGMAVYEALRLLKDKANSMMVQQAASHTAKAGLFSFLYLEVLDATFSFDGVIGAFALTYDIILIAIGLGIGAMFVRSMTILLVDKGTLAEYKYLESGAFMAIIVLASCMLAGIFVNVPETITGTTGVLLIIASVYSSIKANRETLK